jgi:hypothetical protein
LILSLPAAAVAYFSIEKRVAPGHSITVPMILAGFATSLFMIIYWGIIPNGAQQWSFMAHWLSITVTEFVMYSLPVLFAYLLWKNRSRQQTVATEELFWAFFAMFIILTIRDVASARANWGFYQFIHVPILRLTFLLIIPTFVSNFLQHRDGNRLVWIVLTLLMVASLGLAANLGRLNFPVYSIPLTAGLFALGVFMRLNPRLLRA